MAREEDGADPHTSAVSLLAQPRDLLELGEALRDALSDPLAGKPSS
jgi:hypothetical protein